MEWKSTHRPQSEFVELTIKVPSAGEEINEKLLIVPTSEIREVFENTNGNAVVCFYNRANVETIFSVKEISKLLSCTYLKVINKE